MSVEVFPEVAAATEGRLRGAARVCAPPAAVSVGDAVFGEVARAVLVGGGGVLGVVVCYAGGAGCGGMVVVMMVRAGSGRESGGRDWEWGPVGEEGCGVRGWERGRGGGR